MAKYKVITIAIAVKNNRIARFGETVDDSELTVNASELVQAGSLELIEGTSSEVVKKSDKKIPTEEVEKKPEVAEVAKVEEKVIEKAPSAAEKAAEKK